MPLRVHCPNGCLVRMPSSRAGKIVRCPECKLIIEIDTLSKSELLSGKPIPMVAKRVEASDVSEVADDAHEIQAMPVEDDPIPNLPPLEAESNPTQKSEQTESAPFEFDQIESAKNVRDPIESKQDGSPAIGSASQKNQPRLDVPVEFSPISIKQRQEQHKAKLKEALNVPDDEFVIETAKVRKRHPPRFPTPEPTPPPVTPSMDESGINSIMDQPVSWEERVKKSNADRVVLAKFYAVSLCVVALVNSLPALYLGLQWTQSIETMAIPKWIYLQVFMAALHLLYAVFLFQLPDWSALRAVSVAMLVIAFVFGVVSTSLLIGGGQGALVAFLGLPLSKVKSATIWCVAMLCLATLMSYLGGKEASNWQRSEQLLEEILGGNKVPKVEA